MRLLVKRFADDNSGDYHCVDIDTQQKHLVDVYISGSREVLPKDPKELIGKVITVNYLQPYLELAGEVYSVEDSATAI